MVKPGPSATPRAGRIEDARGQLVTQVDPVVLYLQGQHEVIDAPTLKAIAKDPEVRVRPAELAALGTGLFAALLVLILFTHGLVTGDIGDAPFAKTAGLLWLCSMPWIVWYIVRRKRSDQIRVVMLRHRRCPHCAYDIRDLPTDPGDGATVCPECGCAWKLLTRPGAGDPCRACSI